MRTLAITAMKILVKKRRPAETVGHFPVVGGCGIQEIKPGVGRKYNCNIMSEIMCKYYVDIYLSII